MPVALVLASVVALVVVMVTMLMIWGSRKVVMVLFAREGCYGDDGGDEGRRVLIFLLA